MRILIADDNQDAANTLGILLRNWGFDPTLAFDGPSALALLQEPGSPKLALLDWLMPGMNGIDICREIRKESSDRPYTYIVLVTGRGSKEQMLEGLHAGADDYLLKPVEPNELHARLNTAKRILELQSQLLATQQQLRLQATRDSLTGLWNRAMILEILQRELARSRREDQPIAVIMADIDHFKQINDTHGHLAGDQVLRQVAQRLSTALRPYDTVGRYGGEEFLMVLPGCGVDTALNLAERLRHSVEAEPIRNERMLLRSVTLSLGVAVWDGDVSPLELLRLADDALYQAKRMGRNRAIAANKTTV
jgi:two-component system, cell cycle response regulator